MLYRMIKKIKTFRVAPLSLPHDPTFISSLAFSSFNRIFWWQERWEPLILEWDSFSNSFCSDGTKATKYWPALFNVYFACVFAMMSCAFVTFNHTSDPNVSPGIIICSMFVGSWLFLIIAFETLLVKYYNVIIASYQCFRLIIHGLRRETQRSDPIPVQALHGPFRSNCSPAFWKKLITVVVLAQIVLLSLTGIIPTIGAYAQLDPFQFTLPVLFPMLSGLPDLLAVVCFLSTVICANETCRLLSFLFPKVVSLTEIYFSILVHLNRIPYDDPRKFIKWYVVFQVWESLFESYIDIILAVIMGSGFVVTIVSNVATFKSYRMLPLAAYLCFPFASFCASVVALICFPFAVYVAELSGKIVFQRKTHFQLYKNKNAFGLNAERKFIAKRLSCLKPVVLSCGSFYPLKRGAESDYFFYILLRTADVLLAMQNLGIFK